MYAYSQSAKIWYLADPSAAWMPELFTAQFSPPTAVHPTLVGVVHSKPCSKVLQVTIMPGRTSAST